MTPSDSDIATLLALCDAWRGRFFYDEERGDFAYIAADCDNKQCDCERRPNADGDQDCSVSLDDVDDGWPSIARMVNALPAALQALREARGERDAALREADRLRHGAPVEGDWVCPAEVELERYKALLTEALDIGAECALGAQPQPEHAERLDAIRAASDYRPYKEEP